MPQANLGGGAEVMLLNFLIGAREVRPTWRFPVFFLRSGPFVDLVRAHGFEVCAKTDVRLRKPATCLEALKQVWRLSRMLKVNAIFSWIAYGHFFGGLAALCSRLPAVWYQVGFASGWIDRVASQIPAERIFAVSGYVAERQRRLGARRPIVSIWPGIDLSRYGKGDRNELRSRLRLPLEGRIAVLVGRLQRWKGVHTAIAAMPRVIAAVPRARLMIVGGAHDLEPEYPGELAAQMKQSSAEHAVTMVGRQENVADWMSAADVVVHASRGEPFGIVVVEAMACGRPLVTGNDGGVTEAVRDGVEGIHVPYDDQERMAEALIRLFENDGLAKRMGQLGVERARHFSCERYASELCQELESVIANRKAT
jgi:glycosyltransferase involved in cell wall biosynthesis